MTTFLACGQGTFVYDQQSSDENRVLEGGAALGLQPLGQSFAPTNSTIGFIRMHLFGGAFGSGTILINLRSGSITGAVIATTSPVTLANTGPVNFYFDSAVPVAPGTTYFFQPIVQSGGGWGVNLAAYLYSGGTAFIQGVASPGSDLWFREGIVVPEASTTMLVLLGAGLLTAAWRKSNVRP